MDLASRQERRLIRQRGAGARELKGVEFGFTFGAIGVPGSPVKESGLPEDDAEARPGLDHSGLERPVPNADPQKSRGRKKRAGKATKVSEARNDQPQRRTRARTGVARGSKKSIDEDGLDQVRTAAPLARTTKPTRAKKAAKTVVEDAIEETRAKRQPKKTATTKRGRPKRQRSEEVESEAFEDAVESPAIEPTKVPKSAVPKAKHLDVAQPSEPPTTDPRAPSPEPELETDDFKDAVEFQSRETVASSPALSEPIAVEDIRAPSGARHERRKRQVNPEIPDIEKPRRRGKRGAPPDSAWDSSEAGLRRIEPKEDIASANGEPPPKRAQKRTPQQSKPLASKRQKVLAAVPEDEGHVIADATSGLQRGVDESREVVVGSPEAVHVDQASEAQCPPNERLNLSKARSSGHLTRSDNRSKTSFAKARQHKRPHDRTAEEPGDLASILRRYGEPIIPAKLTTNVESRLNFRF